MNAEDLSRFLAEDMGDAGDVTTSAVAPHARVEGVVVAKSRAVLAGAAEAAAVFVHLGAKVEARAQDGAWVEPGDVVLIARGSASAVLAAERLALNLLMRMSGIATATREVADAAREANPRCRVAATRKTTPGFRAFEKRAVVLGGGEPHRFGLFDAFLVKDNHRALLPDVAEAVRRCRAADPTKSVEIEVETLEDALAAAAAGADALLLDNLPPETFRSYAKEIRKRYAKILLEASGGIHPGNVREYAVEADRVSLGFLTHSAPAKDFSLEATVSRSSEDC